MEYGHKVGLSSGASSIVLPMVLAKIGAEVLAVNPYASTASATASFEDRKARRDAGLQEATSAATGAASARWRWCRSCSVITSK